MDFRLKNIWHSERGFITLCIIAVMVLNFLPYFFLNVSKPSGSQYLWSVFNPIDANAYAAKTAQGEAGAWVVENTYSNETDKGSFLYLLYVILGQLGRAIGISSFHMVFAARLFFGIILLVVIYLFMKRLPLNGLERRVAFLLVSFGSGLGRFVDSSPLAIERWLPDARPIERFMDMPHFLLANTLLVVALMSFMVFLEKRKWRIVIIPFVTTLLLGFILPYHIPVLLVALLVFIVMRFWREPMELARFGLIVLMMTFAAMIPLGYYLGLFSRSPILKLVAEQNVIPSPPPIHLISGIGLIGIIGFIGSLIIVRRRERSMSILVAWILAAIALMYIPFLSQRRFFQTAVYVPLSILAAVGFVAFSRMLSAHRRRTVSIVLMLVLGFSILLSGRDIASRASRERLFLYVPQDSVDALRWIEENTPPRTTVLSSFTTGNVLPVFSNRVAFIGHNVETARFREKLQATENFFLHQYTPTDAYEFVRRNRIEYVLYTATERTLHYEDPQEYSFLTNVYENDSAVLYSVEENFFSL